MEKNVAYFISDAHLGISICGREDREYHLIEFLKTIESRASELYILGDLFDFWIEYKHAIRPEFFQILYRLKSLTDTGTVIHYLAGNHDFALGPFLNTQIGIHIHTDSLQTTIQGRRMYLYHGDGILRCDTLYRLLKRILRNRLNQKLYKMLHPNVGVTLASLFSGSSRRFLAKRHCPKRLEEYRQEARRLLLCGFDCVIFGHTHRAEIIHFADKIYLNTGEWLQNFNYATMENGSIALWKYLGKNRRETIASQQRDAI